MTKPRDLTKDRCPQCGKLEWLGHAGSCPTLNPTPPPPRAEVRPRDWVLPLKTLIINDGKGLSAWLRQDREDEIHVIERSYATKLEREIAELKAQYRRDVHAWQTTSIELGQEREKSAGLLEALNKISISPYGSNMTKAIAETAIARYGVK